jgi:RNA polymerase sigma-70 factor (ECF subfamily)
METDLELLERWRSGDREAGGRLVTRHFLDVRTYFRLRMPTDYEDLHQETFTRLSRSLDNFRGESSFRTYLFRIARNVLAEALRKRYRAEFDPIVSSIVDLTGDSQGTIMIEREHLRMLFDSLRALPLDEQDLIELYYFQRIGARELADLFGLAEGGVRSRLRTTLGNLRRVYQQVARRPHEHELDERQLSQWLLELRALVRR